MRIIAGKFGSRKLIFPDNKDVRPTSDKIRGAIFNMLQSRGIISDANILDGFCGTGALGLEALSRGASGCMFIDKTRTSLDIAYRNAQILGIENKAGFTLRDITKIKTRTANQKTYSLIFLDPPYNNGLVEHSLRALINGDWLAAGGWIICESEASYIMGNIDDITLDSEKIYGDTKIVLLRYQPITPE